MKKKFLTLRSVLLLLLMLGIVPLAHADKQWFFYDNNGNQYSITGEGTVELTYGSYYGSDIEIPPIITVEVSNYGEIYSLSYTVTAIESDAFRNRNNLKTIKLPGTVKSIGSNSFYGCSKLSSVTLTDGLESIGSSAFGNCTSLQSIVIPNSVSYMDWNVFYGCTALTDVTLSNRLHELNGTFSFCSSLESVIIPTSVSSLDGTFTNCTSLSTVAVPYSVSNIGEKTFMGCTGLVSVYIPNSVTQIGKQAFSNTGLKVVVIPNTVTSIAENAFEGCNQLTSITSRAVTPPAMSNQNTFGAWIYDNAKLKVPLISETTYKETNWWNLFKDITGDQALNSAYDFVANGIYYNKVDDNSVEVTYKDNNYNSYSGQVTVPASVSHDGKSYSVTGIGNYAFQRCAALTGVTLPATITYIGTGAFAHAGLTAISLPAAVTTIATGAFEECTKLSKLTIPQNVTSIGDQAFAGCSGLTQLNWNAKCCWSNGDLSTEHLNQLTIGNGVEVLPAAFVSQSLITSVTIPASVTSIGQRAFQGCSLMSAITIPKSVSYIGENAFDGSTGLKSLTWNAQDCSTNGNMFTGGISQVTIGGEVEILPVGFLKNARITTVNIPNSVKIINSYAFSGCNQLNALNLPESLTVIGERAFYGCSALSTLTIPRLVSGIGYYAFDECHGLTTLNWDAIDCPSCGDMPSSLSQVNIGNEVKTLPFYFAAGSSITTVTIPASVEDIGSGAFSGCEGLSQIIVDKDNAVYDSRNDCNAIIATDDNVLIVGCKTTVIPSTVTSIGANAFYHCTGLTSIEIPDAVTYIGSYAFNNCSNMVSVTLGLSVEDIDYGAFFGCTSLSRVIALPVTPPEIGSKNYIFDYDASVTVYVLPEALAAYQNADGWSECTLLPTNFNACNLTIGFPDDVDLTRYADMRLEVTRKDGDQSLHYIIGNQRSYTFANLEKNTVWDVTLTNQYGDELGKIDAVAIGDKDVSVTFQSLRQPQTVTLTIKTPAGQDVSDQTRISWLDDDGELLTQGKQISGLPSGRNLTYNVKLPQQLATVYSLPTDMTYMVKDGANAVICQLTAIGQTRLSGKVKVAGTNQPLNGASISVTQTFAGGDTKTLTTQTDNQGRYSLDVSTVPTTLTVAATGYISQTVDCDVTDGSAVTVPDVALSPITGAVVNLRLTYTPAHAQGTSAETQNDYSDYSNVDYEIYNKTTGHKISNISVQYPQIVLMEDINDSDELELTATSRKNAFMPVKTTVVISGQQASATLAILEMGRISAKFKKNLNPHVVGMLYDAVGKLVKTADYAEGSLTIDNIPDGDYVLITMGKSDFFNSIYDLEQFGSAGLAEGDDYVKTEVHIESGIITQVSIDEVPPFDESKLYYTSELTSFSVNKTNPVIGDYLTFRAQIGFKEQYKNRVSDVQLIVDLPESCSFYENSVLVGANNGGYTTQGNRIFVPLADWDDVAVLFCAKPLVAGEYSPSAFVQFRINGKTVLQPIGNVIYSARNLSLYCPFPYTGNKTIPVGGTASNGRVVHVYDGDVKIAQTHCLENGSWSVMADLYQPVSPSVHTIHAEVQTSDGVLLPTVSTQVHYMQDVIMLNSIEMIYYGQSTIYDLELGRWTNLHYTYEPVTSLFTFIARFVGNAQALMGLNFHIFDQRGHETIVAGVYDSELQGWVCSASYPESNCLPVSVTVSFDFFWGGVKYSYVIICDPPSDYPYPPVEPLVDPSGFVYEAVPSNRLQGVKATCYYKDNETGNPVLWDAEQYSQENPLLTDENGYYRWDVPIGMWQVKYEKEGYETTYSDWLPVPPPQLDVNIGMVQMRQPEVIKARAYTNAVELEFDKYMAPEDLTTRNIKVTDEWGYDVYGYIELLNAEVDDPNAITTIRRAPGTGLTFASKVRFNAEDPFYCNEVTLHVSKQVKSYAGLEMGEDYVVTLPVENEMRKISVDTTVTMLHGDSRQLTVTVEPAMASKGKTLTVRSFSPMIISTDAETYTLDNNGKAVVTVHGDLPGMGSLLYGIDGYDMNAATLVNVMMESQMTVAMPVASIASGSEVDKGTTVYLQCATDCATIYYTLDGSNPSDVSSSRMEYDGMPIVIDGNVTLKAMAMAPGLYDSEVATFVYRVAGGKKGDVNGDGEVNIADVNAAIGVILHTNTDSEMAYRADVNGDGEVNIADINEIIRIILNPSNEQSMTINCKDRLHIDDVTMKPGEVRTIQVTVDHATRYSAVQCDVVLPAGVTLVASNATRGNVSRMGRIDERASRVLTYSEGKCAFAQDNQGVITLTLRADEAIAADSEIKLTHVILSGADDKAWHAADCVSRVNNSSSVNELTMLADDVWVEGNTLFIDACQDGIAQLVAINGVVIDIPVKAGINQQHLESGIYVVVINSVSHKIAIK